MSRPVVSDAAERMYATLTAYQEDEEAGGWILLHRCEAFARMLAKVNDVLRYDTTGSGWRRTHDPDRAAAWTLPWLAQHAGITALPASLTEAEQRALIRDAPAMRRGTPGAIVAAARSTLTGTKRVILLEREGGAYQLTAITRTSETPDPAGTLAALLTQKPAGIVLTHLVVEGTIWPEATSTWDTVDPALTWAASIDEPV